LRDLPSFPTRRSSDLRSLLQAVKNADWVIESISEDLMAKQRLFDSIEQVAGHDALLTSSSSGLPPGDIFARCRRQDRCLVAHPRSEEHTSELQSLAYL